MSAAHEPGTGGFGEREGGFAQRALAAIERIGNKVPSPAVLFIALCVIVIVLSQLLDWLNVSVTSEVVVVPEDLEQRQDGVSALPDAPDDYAVETETFAVEGLLTADGIRFMFTSFVPNFLGFTAMGVILVAMIGVGVAELSGLIGGLIRKLVAISRPATLTYIIVFVGILSSIAADAGYLVLIPLAATAFLTVGRHPLAGIAAGFGAVSAAFGINVLIVPADAVITDITNEAAALVDPDAGIDLLSNLYFGIGSTLFLTIVIALVTTRVIEPRLGDWDRSLADEDELAREEGVEVDAALEARGLRHAGLAMLAVLVLIALLTLPSGAPLRHPETGDIVGDSPFMSSLIVMISLAFLAAGVAYGRVVGTIKGSDDVFAMITKSWATLASLLFLFLLIAQFIAYFDFSNMARVAVVWLGDLLEEIDPSDVWLLLGVMLVTVVVNLLIPAKIAKWAILAPIFVPLMLRLGIEPQTVLAAYRVGDSPTNVLTPLMPYFALIVVFAARYQKDAGIGTVMALMIPYTLVLTVAWTVFFFVWYALGIPLGPGWPVR
jgi:aminobenzoyl-glutamate transport protein